MKLRGPWLDDSSRDVINQDCLDLALSAFPNRSPYVWLVGEESAQLQSGLVQSSVHVKALDIDVHPIKAFDTALAESGRPDMVVMLNSLDRCRRTLHEPDYVALLTWLRTNCDLALLEAPRDPIAPGFVELGPYEVTDIVKVFPYVLEHASSTSHRSLVPPRLIASSRWSWESGSWTEHLSAPLLHHGKSASSKTLELASDAILKQDAVCDDYNQVSDVVREARFLSSASQDECALLRLPRILRFEPGRCVNTLVREKVPGSPITETDGEARAEVIAAVIDLAQRYSRAGIFHNDVRPWNVLWDGNQASFIDFAGVADFEDDTEGLPQILALNATLATITFPAEASRIPFAEYAWTLWGSTDICKRHGVADLMDRPWRQLAHTTPVIDHSETSRRFSEAFLISLLALQKTALQP